MLANSISSWKPDTEHQPSGEMQNKNKNSVWIMKSEICRFNRFFLAEVIDSSHGKLIQDLFCLVWYCKWYIFLPKNTGLGFSLIISWVGQSGLIWFWMYKVRALCHLMCEKLLDCGIIQFLQFLCRHGSHLTVLTYQCLVLSCAKVTAVEIIDLS